MEAVTGRSNFARRFAALVLAVFVAGCAAPQLHVPGTPIALTRVVEGTKLALDDDLPDSATVAVNREHLTQRHDEFALTEYAFRPTLPRALDAFLVRELGPLHGGQLLKISNMTVKVRRMTSPSDTAEGMAAGARSAQTPGAPAGAGLAAALIASAIVEVGKSAASPALVLVNVEGDFGSLAFAGFAFGRYDPEVPHDSIENTVLAAFTNAATSLKSRLSPPLAKSAPNPSR